MRQSHIIFGELFNGLSDFIPVELREEREIIDVDYIDITDEVQPEQPEEIKLIGNSEDTPIPNQ